MGLGIRKVDAQEQVKELAKTRYYISGKRRKVFVNDLKAPEPPKVTGIKPLSEAQRRNLKERAVGGTIAPS